MSFEPQKFFIGLIDFFSVLLPGALLVYVLTSGDPAFLALGLPELRLDDGEAGAVFVVGSYLVGHLIFLTGSALDSLYDFLKDGTALGQRRSRLAKGRALRPRWFRRRAERFFDDRAVVQVERLKAAALQTLSPSTPEAINAFQWSRARLSKEHPEGFATVQRFEADSKFFRSFVVVLAILIGVYVAAPKPPLIALCFALLLLSFFRYVDQRFKATQHAYWHLITLDARDARERPPRPAAPREDGLTHAGGVVFRTQKKAIEYLVVQASKTKDEWVLPKGHIELGEAPRETAVREVHEETGCLARVLEPLHLLRFAVEGVECAVAFYRMEQVEEDVNEAGRERWAERERKAEWLPFERAKKRLSFDDARALLDRAEELRKKGTQEREPTPL
jgi:8-oxo-dGTP pyrophosphatase MutT (NUDIX family)